MPPSVSWWLGPDAYASGGAVACASACLPTHRAMYSAAVASRSPARSRPPPATGVQLTSCIDSRTRATAVSSSQQMGTASGCPSKTGVRLRHRRRGLQCVFCADRWPPAPTRSDRASGCWRKEAPQPRSNLLRRFGEVGQGLLRVGADGQTWTEPASATSTAEQSTVVRSFPRHHPHRVQLLGASPAHGDFLCSGWCVRGLTDGACKNIWKYVVHNWIYRYTLDFSWLHIRGNSHRAYALAEVCCCGSTKRREGEGWIPQLSNSRAPNVIGVNA